MKISEKQIFELMKIVNVHMFVLFDSNKINEAILVREFIEEITNQQSDELKEVGNEEG